MKKIINKPERVVPEMCHGMALAYPDLDFVEKYKIIKRKNLNSGKVSLISGGGCGHEPAHAGFVGRGMLDAAVCGDVFASPSQIQVYQAIKAACSSKGILLIVKNYSGDMMNFKNAAYLAKEDGIDVDYVKVDDDIAVQDSTYTVGRRGVAGTIFVHKLAGAAAERGWSLKEVKAVAEKTIASVKTIGFALTSCTVPAKGTPTFDIGEDEMEYGVGIHGEPGIRREKSVSADEIAERAVTAILNELSMVDNDEHEVAVLINGLGGSPVQELYVLNHSVRRVLAEKGIKVVYTLVGNYMTSIDMMGASVSLLKLDEELKRLLFAPCDTVGLRVNGFEEAVPFSPLHGTTEKKMAEVHYELETNKAYSRIENEVITKENMIFLVDAMSDCIIRNEVPFCELDSHAGDGDFGMSVAKGFKKLKEEWASILATADGIGEFLDACSMVIMEHCGGASGPIWGSAFRAAGKYAAGKKILNKTEFAEMLQSAVAGIQKTGERSFGRGAVEGDKTLMDALIPCADTWTELAATDAAMTDIFAKAATAAVAGAKKTERIAARMGRAGTVGDRSIGYPDAGAYALGVIFTEIVKKIS